MIETVQEHFKIVQGVPHVLFEIGTFGEDNVAHTFDTQIPRVAFYFALGESDRVHSVAAQVRNV